MEELVNAVLAWWEEHRYDVTGYHGGYNVYDEEPEFVTIANKLREDKEEVEQKDKEEVYYNFGFKSAIDLFKHVDPSVHELDALEKGFSQGLANSFRNNAIKKQGG